MKVGELVELLKNYDKEVEITFQGEHTGIVPYYDAVIMVSFQELKNSEKRLVFEISW